MKQNYFEREQIHPYVAALLKRDGWVYHHEYAFADGSRADFVAIQRHTGRIAIVECKIAINSTNDLINQVSRYYDQLGYACALKWVFVLNTPHSGTIKRLNEHKIALIPLEDEYPIDPADIGRASRVEFAQMFMQLKPLLAERDELNQRRYNLIKRMTMLGR